MKKRAGIPVFLIAALLPLAFYFHIETIEFSQYPWFPNQGYWLDWFLYGKSLLLQVMSMIMAGTLIVFKIKNKKNHACKENLLLLAAGGMIVLSAVFSDFPMQSFFGSIEQYESVGVLLSYLILLAFVTKFTINTENVTLIEKALLIGFSLSCILGILQFMQCDLWSSGIGKSLLVPKAYEQLRDNLRFSEDSAGFGRVYMALYNSSYAGIYIVMVLPFLALSENKYIRMLLIPAILCLIGTMSKTAWFAAILIACLGVFMTMKSEQTGKIRKKWLYGVSGIFVIGMLLLVFVPTEDGVMTGQKRLQEVEGTAENIRIVYQGNTIYFSEYPQDEGVHYKVLDENGDKILLSWCEERGELDPVDSKYEGLHFKVYLKDGISYAVFRYEDVVFRFTDDLGTGKYEYVSINGKPDLLTEAKTLTNIGDSFLNGRGYIWNRVFPVIRENLVLGTGPDTFLQVFPQNDYVARANLGYGFFSEILTNAHSLYLHTALQTGVISLLCMLIFVGIYLKRTWNMYVHKEIYDKTDKLGIACFLGSVGYLICGLTFSSSVCTTPIFVILMGCGIGIQICSKTL